MKLNSPNSGSAASMALSEFAIPPKDGSSYIDTRWKQKQKKKKSIFLRRC